MPDTKPTKKPRRVYRTVRLAGGRQATVVINRDPDGGHTVVGRIKRKRS